MVRDRHAPARLETALRNFFVLCSPTITRSQRSAAGPKFTPEEHKASAQTLPPCPAAGEVCRPKNELALVIIACGYGDDCSRHCTQPPPSPLLHRHLCFPLADSSTHAAEQRPPRPATARITALLVARGCCSASTAAAARASGARCICVRRQACAGSAHAQASCPGGNGWLSCYSVRRLVQALGIKLLLSATLRCHVGKPLP